MTDKPKKDDPKKEVTGGGAGRAPGRTGRGAGTAPGTIGGRTPPKGYGGTTGGAAGKKPKDPPPTKPKPGK